MGMGIQKPGPSLIYGDRVRVNALKFRYSYRLF